MNDICEELKLSKPFSTTNEALSVAILLTSERLRTLINKLCRQFDITIQQYNLLRILRGSFPLGLSCNEINGRMIQRSPDITRMISRLEQLGYVNRFRDEQDNRVVRTVIQQEGIHLIESMENTLGELHGVFDVMSEEERCMALTILGRIRGKLNQMISR